MPYKAAAVIISRIINLVINIEDVILTNTNLPNKKKNAVAPIQMVTENNIVKDNFSFNLLSSLL